MALLKRHKQDLWETIAAAGLSPLEFDWSPEVDPQRADMLKHKSEPWLFGVEHGIHTDYFRLSFHPGDGIYLQRVDALSWGEVLLYASTWASAVADEAKAVDPWRAAEGINRLLAEDSSDQDDNSLRTPDELAAVREALRALQAQVNELLDSHQQTSAELRLYVARRFDYLEDALSRMGRRDWRTMFQDFMTNVVAGLTLQISPEAATGVIELARTALRAIG